MATNTSNGTGSSESASKTAKPAARKRAASTAKRSASQKAAAPKRRVNTGNRSGRTGQYRRTIRNRVNDIPSWVSTLASVVGVGVAVGAGLFATRNQWLPRARDWADDFNAAYADDETDGENFSQTRHAGRDSMRDDPGEEWDDIDDISDASFPASDPPSFSPKPA